MLVKKQRVAVRIAQTGHDPLDGFFSLTTEARDGQTAETIFELLNSPQRVIPFIVENDGAVILLTRLNLDWVMAGSAVDPSLILPHRYVVGREEPVELHFMNAASIDGMIQIEKRSPECRVSDFLNRSSDFYPVHTRFGMLLVNKSAVRETRLSTIAPNWKEAAAPGHSQPHPEPNARESAGIITSSELPRRSPGSQ